MEKTRTHEEGKEEGRARDFFSIFERRISLSINYTIISPDFQDFAEEIGEVKEAKKKNGKK